MGNFQKSLWSASAVLGAIALTSPVNAGQAADDEAAEEIIDQAKFNFDHVSCIGAKNEIRIVVSGVKDSIGLITADLYPNDQEAFLKGPLRVSQVKFAARSPATKFCIRAPEHGSYAVALYHDENANGGFDKGAFGMPAEPWGISNNPKVRFAAPPVEKALFSVGETGAKLEIELN